MKQLRIGSLLLLLVLLMTLVSCRSKSAGNEPAFGGSLPTSTQTRQPATPTRMSFNGTASTWTGNDVQPQELVYPTETYYPGVSTARPTSTPRPSATLRNNPTTNTATATRKPNGPTSAPTNTPRYTATVTPTASATTQAGWTGDWVVYYGVDDNSLQTGSMTLSLDGRNLSAQASFGSLEMVFTGILSQQDQEASGTYTHPTDPGWFYWNLVSANQFGGTLNEEFVFCANRPGGQRPNPCGVHPTY